MGRTFYTLDVFTATPLTGNPLAVVLDAERLEDAQMQAIAREFNLAETVFVLSPQDRQRRARLRIFTPARELPFAGHPTVGAAVLLACLDHGDVPGTYDVELEEGVGVIRCSVDIRDGGHGRASFTLAKLPEPLGRTPPPEVLAAALGLQPNDLTFGKHIPSCYSAGVPFLFVPLASRDAVTRARPQTSDWDSALHETGCAAVYVYCRQPSEPRHHYHARMFAPGMGIPEDPASGSAVAALSAQIMACDRPSDGEHTLSVEQGYAMGRPSVIDLAFSVADGMLVEARIGGPAVVVTEGQLRV